MPPGRTHRGVAHAHARGGGKVVRVELQHPPAVGDGGGPAAQQVVSGRPLVPRLRRQNGVRWWMSVVGTQKEWWQ